MNYRDLVNAIRDAVETAKWPTSGRLRLNCPVCDELHGSEDRRLSLSVDREEFWFNCWRCGAKGKLEDVNEPPPPSTDYKHDRDPNRLPESWQALWEAPGTTASAYAHARAYLRSRHVAQPVWREAGLGACTSGPLAQRIIVPVWDDAGVMVGWVGRTWRKDSDLKVLNASGNWRDDAFLNGAALWQLPPGEAVLAVEGPFDALRQWPRAVAFLGKPTHDQVTRLAMAKRPVVVALDGDAWMEGYMLASALRLRGVTCGVLTFQPGQDPGTTDPELVRQAMALSLEDGVERVVVE